MTPALSLGLCASLLFAQGASADTKSAPKAMSALVPASLLNLGEGTPRYAFLVDKSAQRLHLYRQDADGPQLVESFVCATGRNPGEKLRQGDKRTPEGVYFFTRVMESRALAPIYGIRAFPMDYPNLLDRMASLRGNGIWLHGTDKPLESNSTSGCVALENRDVARLSDYIRLKETPIIIEDKLRYSTWEEVQAERDRFRELLDGWVASWQAKELDRYMSFYSKDFRSKGMGWDGWRDHKDRLNRQYQSIEVKIDSPIILRHGRTMVASFFQTYRSDRYFNEGTKRLYAALEKGGWKIIGEEWAAERGGEAPPPIPQRTLLTFLRPKPGPKARPAPAQAARKAGRGQPDKAAEIQAFLAQWKRSWEQKDLDRYMDCYSEAFRGQGKSREQWRRHKIYLSSRYRRIQVSLEGVEIQQKDGEAVVSFRQVYRSDALKSAGQKSLVLRREGDSWKIFRENFRRT